MYTLTDTFNASDISRHRTLLAALKAAEVHAMAVRRHNGATSYIPVVIANTEEPGVLYHPNGRIETGWPYCRTDADGMSTYGVE